MNVRNSQICTFRSSREVSPPSWACDSEDIPLERKGVSASQRLAKLDGSSCDLPLFMQLKLPR